MPRYIIDWDFSGEDNDYAAKAKAATALCEKDLDGIRISRSTWMVEYVDDPRKLVRAFAGAVYADGRKLMRPWRDGSGQLHGDHFNICEVGFRAHSDHVTIDSWFEPLAALERLLQEL